MMTSEHSPHTCFVSGHIDLTPSQFALHYAPTLSITAKSGHAFVLSNALGADSMALEYLLANARVEPARITIYMRHAGDGSRGRDSVQLEKDYKTRGMNVKRVKGTHWDRDAAMTMASNDDILWVRPAEETKAMYGAMYRPGRVSGTEKNRLRRIEKDQGREADAGVGSTKRKKVPGADYV